MLELKVSYAAHLTEDWLAGYLYRGEAVCVVCEAAADDVRGWVKSPDALKTSPTYWLCNDCLDKRPALKWDGPWLRRVTFDSR